MKTRTKIVTATAGGIALISIIASAAGSSHKAPHAPAPAVTPVTAPAATQSVTPVPAALSGPDQQFVSAVRDALTASGATNTSVTDAQIAHLGQQVCTARKAGGSQASIIAATRGSTESRFSMSARQFTLAAERAICPGEVAKRQTVTFIVTGTPGADVTYGPAGTDLTGSVPMRVTEKLGNPSYYAISAQLQGSGEIACRILVDGKTISHASAAGGFNLADCEISKDIFGGGWQNDE